MQKCSKKRIKLGWRLNCSVSDQVCKAYKEHLVYSVMCVQIFTGNMCEMQKRPQNICVSAFRQKPDEESTVLALKPTTENQTDFN